MQQQILSSTSKPLRETGLLIVKNASTTGIEELHSYQYSNIEGKSEEEKDISGDIASSSIQRKWEDDAGKAGTSNSPQYESIIVDKKDIQCFINLVDITCLESGYISDAEQFVEELCEKKGYPYIIYFMNEIYAKNIKNELLMCALMNIVSHIDYANLGFPAVSFSMAMIANGTPLMWEYVINACDSWNSMDFVDCLERINTDSIVLKQMIEKVVLRIKRYNRR